MNTLLAVPVTEVPMTEVNVECARAVPKALM